MSIFLVLSDGTDSEIFELSACAFTLYLISFLKV